MPELSVVVPAFRERDNVDALLAALRGALHELDWELIVVVDEPSDGTEQLVRLRAREDARIRCIHRAGRRGLASACIEGMLSSTSPFIAVMDADLQHDESILPEMVRRARGADVDLVVGSRYLEAAGADALGPARLRLSRAAGAVGRKLCPGLSDPLSGYFVARRAFVERVIPRLYGRGFKLLLDMVAAAGGKARIEEVAYRMRSRQRGESKLGVAVAMDYVLLVVYHLFARRLVVPARGQRRSAEKSQA